MKNIHSQLFLDLQNSLIDLIRKDDLLIESRFTLSLIHRLGMYIENEISTHQEIFEKPVIVDACFPLPGLATKIHRYSLVVHQERENPLLHTFVGANYFTNSDLLEIYRFSKKASKALCTAIMINPNKDYVLLYQFDKDNINYYHFNYSDMRFELYITKNVIKNKKQLSLKLV